MAKICLRLSFYREQFGLSQKEVAESLGVSVNTVSSWETQSYLPSMKHLFYLSVLFGIKMDDLVRVIYDE